MILRNQLLSLLLLLLPHLALPRPRHPLQDGEHDRTGHDRQIQPLSCVSRDKTEQGVCMFAWNCVKAGGKHLGTCIDRFYFGSCCLISNKEVLDNSLAKKSEINTELNSNSLETDSADVGVALGESDITSSQTNPSTSPRPTIVPSLSPVVSNASTTTEPIPVISTVTPKSTSTTSELNTDSSEFVSSTIASIPSTSVESTTASSTSTLSTATTSQSTTVATSTSSITTMGIRVTTLISSFGTSSKPVAFNQDTTEVTNADKTSFESVFENATTASTIKQDVTAAMEDDEIAEFVKEDVEDISVDILDVHPLESSTQLSQTTIQPAPSEDSTMDVSAMLDEDMSAFLANIEDKNQVKPNLDTWIPVVIELEDNEIVDTGKPIKEEFLPGPDAPVGFATTPSDISSDPTSTSIDPSDASTTVSSILSTTMLSLTSTSTESSSSSEPNQTATSSSTSSSIPSSSSTVKVSTSSTSTVMTTTITTEANVSTTTATTTSIEISSTMVSSKDPTTLSTESSTTESPVTDSTTPMFQPTTSEQFPTTLLDSTTFSSTAVSDETTSPRASIPDIDADFWLAEDFDFANASYKDLCGRQPWIDPKFRRRKSSREGRVVNGETTEYAEWPWQISLRQWRTATFLHKCGAALLTENWAITAAHCVINVDPDSLMLRMGEFDLGDELEEEYTYQDRKVAIVVTHTKFDPLTFEYDLALLRFHEPVEFSPNVIPVCIPEDDDKMVGEIAWVTGWGRLYEEGPLPSVLQEVNLPVIKNQECEVMYERAGYREHIPDIFICAGYSEGGKDSCEGDSGGPMTVQRKDGRFKLAGVISWGIGCAKRNQPGVMTRISYFRDWINTFLKF